jgi:hypothetical protein
MVETKIENQQLRSQIGDQQLATMVENNRKEIAELKVFNRGNIKVS